jgi:hypothetical protein
MPKEIYYQPLQLVFFVLFLYSQSGEVDVDDLGVHVFSKSFIMKDQVFIATENYKKYAV